MNIYNELLNKIPGNDIIKSNEELNDYLVGYLDVITDVYGISNIGPRINSTLRNGLQLLINARTGYSTLNDLKLLFNKDDSYLNVILKMCEDEYIKNSFLQSIEDVSKENILCILNTLENVFGYLEKTINSIESIKKEIISEKV